MTTLIGILAAAFWIWVIVGAIRGSWRFATRPRLDDPNNPPDIANFAPSARQDDDRSSDADRSHQP